MINLDRTSSNNLMLDIETLGVNFNSAVIQIAMIRFDFNRNIYSHFVGNLEYKSQLSKGLITEEKTINWWKEQNTEILKDILSESSDTLEVLNTLDKYIQPNDTIWSSGNFDVPILANLYKAFGKEVPWRYYNALDIRVLTKLANINIRTDYNYMKEKTHNALDDCKFQINYCCDAIDILEK